MQVVNLIDSDVQRRTLQFAWRQVGARQVDDHLALRSHGRHDERLLVGRVLQRRRSLHQIRLVEVVANHFLGSSFRSHIVQGSHLAHMVVLLVPLLEGVVRHESVRIDAGGVNRVVHVLQQTALAEGGLPDTNLVGIGKLSSLADKECGTCKGRYVGFGNHRRALAVQVERCGLSAHHVQCVVVPTCEVEVLMAGHHLRLLSVVQHQVSRVVEVQLQFRLQLVALDGRCGRLEHHLVLIRASVVPQFDGIALAAAGAYLRDVGLRAFPVGDAQSIVHILQFP